MASASSSPVLENSVSSRRLVVLVVEDHALIRQAALHIVGETGYEALEAESADEAIKILESRTDVRLVFTDVEMRGTMDGLKLAHYIRERWPPVQLIVASGKAILREGDLPVGATFFSKPYHEATIMQKIKELLG